MTDVTLSNGETYRVSFVHSSPFSGEYAELPSGEVLRLVNRKTDKDGNVLPRSGIRDHVDTAAERAHRRLTFCAVQKLGHQGNQGDGFLETLTTAGDGIAMCHPRDNFSKVKGCKVALGNALRAAGFNYTARAEFWNIVRHQYQMFKEA